MSDRVTNLNADGHSVKINRDALALHLRQEGEDFFQLITQNCPYIFASVPLFVSSVQVEQMKADMPFKEDVKWIGYMNVDELSKVIGGAYALVYASLFEGFGIPILEALQCDVPAIVSNTSSMPEVAGEAALLVDPSNPEDIADKMHRIYKDEALRAKLIANAKDQRKKFDWQGSADRLWASMMKCVS